MATVKLKCSALTLAGRNMTICLSKQTHKTGLLWDIRTITFVYGQTTILIITTSFKLMQLFSLISCSFFSGNSRDHFLMPRRMFVLFQALAESLKICRIEQKLMQNHILYLSDSVCFNHRQCGQGPVKHYQAAKHAI